MTGSISGIGLACARAFASAGANILFNGMDAPAEVEKSDLRSKTISEGVCLFSGGIQCGGLAAKANQRASVTGEDRD